MRTRPTSAFIDTEALKSNYLALKSKMASSTSVMAIIKANAYGHGATEAARALEPLGCELFGVAIPEEGMTLREAGVRIPIVTLGGFFPGQEEALFEYGLTPVVFDIRTARLLNDSAQKRGVVKNIHVKIDTGMGRLGLQPDEAAPFLREVKGLTSLKVEAMLSHFAEAESEEKGFSKKQLSSFAGIVNEARSIGFTPAYTEMANSAALVDLPEAHFNLVRPGIMLYGSYPAEQLRGKIELKPVLSLKTRIMHLKTVPPGATVSYGRRFTAKRKSVIATLPIGYADGLPRRFGSGGGEALVRGMRAPVAGTVCMDLTMIDVTDVPDVQTGDEAVIIGRQRDNAITVEEVAERAGTISYEILCGISARVPRVYV